MTKRTLILTIDLQTQADWQIRAMQAQMRDWLIANKTLLSYEDLVILPTKGDTRLYWLEGTAEDIKTLEEIKSRVEPVLQVALNLKIDKEKKYKAPKRKL